MPSDDDRGGRAGSPPDATDGATQLEADATAEGLALSPRPDVVVTGVVAEAVCGASRKDGRTGVDHSSVSSAGPSTDCELDVIVEVGSEDVWSWSP